MKKYAALLLFALFLNGCDDGDLTVDEIDFEDIAEGQACDATTNALLYKLKPQEALLLQMPEGSIKNDNSTYSYPINSSTYRVVYRAYDGAITKENICGTIPPSIPKVTEEWLGLDGTIEITSIQKDAPTNKDNPDLGTRITGYQHTIVFKNITFQKPTGKQTEPKFEFGIYNTTVTPADLTFRTNPNGSAYECDDIKRVYNYNLSFYLSIDDIDPKLLVNDVTDDKPRTSLISSTQNKVFYRTAKAETGSITPAFICANVQPASPVIEETWTGVAGKENESGIIEVTTTSSPNALGTVYTHTIVLKNVTLQRGNSTFNLGTNFLLGKIDRQENN
ncbi:hypothetical protein [Flavobacterium anhuiense]|uniref:hypothetical protein n=1 Tax=Flavobacterium anhuiense TaxID=459526 RepID=UPI003D96F10B